MTARAEHAVVLQAASLLLAYPDGRLREELPTHPRGRRGVPPRRPGERLLAFLDHVEATPAQALEEHYVAVLDRNAAAAST